MLTLGIDWNPSPVLFNLFSFPIQYYGLMFVCAFLLGIQIMKRIYKNEGVNVEFVDSLFMYVVAGTLIGARLGEVFFYNWDYFQHHLLEIFLPIKEQADGSWEFTGYRGLASHGAAIAIIASMILYRRKYNYKSTLWILDRIVIPVAIGGAFVRLGNLMNSEIVGKVTGSDYGFRFVRDQIGKGEAMQIAKTNDFEKAYDMIGSKAEFAEVLQAIPFRHPTQLYESMSYVVLFVLLWFIYWKTTKKNQEGFLFGVFMVCLWTIRFFIEFFKEGFGGIEEHFSVGLNTGQLLSIPMVLVGVFFMWRASKKAVTE